MRQWSHDYPELDGIWFENSNYLALLSVSNENDLHKLITKASAMDVKVSCFREPDLNNEVTAIVLEPCKVSKKLCANLPLALSEIE